MLDGCRWDYFSRNEEIHEGFQKFKYQGVVADYVQPIFPASSFQSWTTINTGLFPESHQIIGNNMHDRETKENFTLGDDSSTGNPKWWTGHIPIWTSLTHQGYKVSLHHWSRCDVPFFIDGEEIHPKICTPYLDEENGYTDDIPIFTQALYDTYNNIRSGEIDVGFVYYPTIDTMGHGYGPEGEGVVNEVYQVDKVFSQFLTFLEKENMADVVNIIVVADHGMTERSNFAHDKLSNHLTEEAIEAIDIIVDGGNIGVKVDKIDLVYEELEKWTDMKVYKHDEIPDYLRVQQAKYGLDILLTLGNNQVTLGADNDYGYLYLPQAYGDESEEAQSKGGDHGYEDITDGYEKEGNFPDMRAIFMAIGPAFKSNYANPWIKLVDEYQVMMAAVNALTAPHNGTWERVRCMFKDESC